MMLCVDAVGVGEPLLPDAFAEVRRAQRFGKFGEYGVNGGTTEIEHLVVGHCSGRVVDRVDFGVV